MSNVTIYFKCWKRNYYVFSNPFCIWYNPNLVNCSLFERLCMNTLIKQPMELLTTASFVNLKIWHNIYAVPVLFYQLCAWTNGLPCQATLLIELLAAAYFQTCCEDVISHLSGKCILTQTVCMDKPTCFPGYQWSCWPQLFPNVFCKIDITPIR